MKGQLRRPESWAALRQWTNARVAVGRVGDSLPTSALLEFAEDHAAARDAVHASLDAGSLASRLHHAGFSTVRAHSRAGSRSEYLRRPDLGRRLAPECVPLLGIADAPVPSRLTVVVADGLSSQAPAAHALPVLLLLREALPEINLDSVVIATGARVALADEIGALRGAELVLILLGERPGLKSPDSLGAYLTWHPRVGRTDAERNCVSNIRPAGLSYATASHKLAHLVRGARLLRATGVLLKDSSEDNCQGSALPVSNDRAVALQDGSTTATHGQPAGMPHQDSPPTPTAHRATTR